MLIERYVFYAFYETVAFKLNYLVNQQKRVAVRKNFGDCADIEQSISAELGGAFLPFRGLIKFVRKLVIQRMAAFIGNDSAFYCPADQRKVAYEVNYFMPDALIGKPVRVFNGTVGINNENIPRRQMCPHPVRLELPGLDLEKKRPGAGEVLLETLGGQATTVNLPADSGVPAVVEVVCDIQRIVRETAARILRSRLM